jgi:hypothetical protein
MQLAIEIWGPELVMKVAGCKHAACMSSQGAKNFLQTARGRLQHAAVADSCN